MKRVIFTIFLSTIVLFQTGCDEIAELAGGVTGCMLQDASNYDAGALAPCVTECLGDKSGANCCCEDIVYGCMDPTASNYTELASAACSELINGVKVDNACCINEVSGCTDEAAANYNALANKNDDSCTYESIEVTLADGTTASVTPGCMNIDACNYVSVADADCSAQNATIATNWVQNDSCCNLNKNSSCYLDLNNNGYYEEVNSSANICDCGDLGVGWVSEDKVAEDMEVQGCTSPTVDGEICTEYNPLANVDNGGCCQLEFSFEDYANFDESSLDFMGVFDVEFSMGMIDQSGECVMPTDSMMMGGMDMGGPFMAQLTLGAPNTSGEGQLQYYEVYRDEMAFRPEWEIEIDSANTESKCFEFSEQNGSDYFYCANDGFGVEPCEEFDMASECPNDRCAWETNFCFPTFQGQPCPSYTNEYDCEESDCEWSVDGNCFTPIDEPWMHCWDLDEDECMQSPDCKLETGDFGPGGIGEGGPECMDDCPMYPDAESWTETSECEWLSGMVNSACLSDCDMEMSQMQNFMQMQYHIECDDTNNDCVGFFGGGNDQGDCNLNCGYEYDDFCEYDIPVSAEFSTCCTGFDTTNCPVEQQAPINQGALDECMVKTGITFSEGVQSGGGDSLKLTLAFNSSVDSVTSVRMTGPWWSWDPAGGPVATMNQDNSWTVTLASMTSDMEYLWVVNGSQEILYDEAAAGECTNMIDAGILVTDYYSWGNRWWKMGTPNRTDFYDSCQMPMQQHAGTGIFANNLCKGCNIEQLAYFYSDTTNANAMYDYEVVIDTTISTKPFCDRLSDEVMSGGIWGCEFEIEELVYKLEAECSDCSTSSTQTECYAGVFGSDDLSTLDCAYAAMVTSCSATTTKELDCVCDPDCEWVPNSDGTSGGTCKDFGDDDFSDADGPDCLANDTSSAGSWDWDTKDPEDDPDEFCTYLTGLSSAATDDCVGEEGMLSCFQHICEECLEIGNGMCDEMFGNGGDGMNMAVNKLSKVPTPTDTGLSRGSVCEEGYLEDCSGDGDCCDQSWLGDGYGDCADQEFGCDLSCYNNDDGDCEASFGESECVPNSPCFDDDNQYQSACLDNPNCAWVYDDISMDSYCEPKPSFNPNSCGTLSETDCSQDNACQWYSESMPDDPGNFQPHCGPKAPDDCFTLNTQGSCDASLTCEWEAPDWLPPWQDGLCYANNPCMTLENEDPDKCDSNPNCEWDWEHYECVESGSGNDYCDCIVSHSQRSCVDNGGKWELPGWAIDCGDDCGFVDKECMMPLTQQDCYDTDQYIDPCAEFFQGGNQSTSWEDDKCVNENSFSDAGTWGLGDGCLELNWADIPDPLCSDLRLQDEQKCYCFDCEWKETSMNGECVEWGDFDGMGRKTDQAKMRNFQDMIYQLSGTGSSDGDCLDFQFMDGGIIHLVQDDGEGYCQTITLTPAVNQ